MKKTKLALIGCALLITVSSCKKVAPTEKEKVLMVNVVAGSGSSSYEDGIGPNAKFIGPQSLTIDASGNIFLIDAGRIRKITPEGVVTTIAGSGVSGYADGTGTAAMFSTSIPAGITIDAAGNLYLADFGNSCIRKITPLGVVTTVAGTPGDGFADGPGSTAKFSGPQGIAIDASNNLYVADFYNYRVRKITPSGMVSTLIGDGSRNNLNYKDGPIATATIMRPQDIVIDVAGNIYVATVNSVGQYNMIRKITPSGMVSTFAGSLKDGYVNASGFQSQFGFIGGIGIDQSGNIYVADEGNQCVRKIKADGYVSLFAGVPSNNVNTAYSLDGISTEARFMDVHDVAVDSKGNVYTIEPNGGFVRKISLVEMETGKNKNTWNNPRSWGNPH